MRVAFEAAGGKIVAAPVDREGLVIDALPAKADVICVSPSHQFPLGVAMSERRRAALIAYARRCGASIVEDDYDAEFRAEGAPLKAIRQARGADAVFYVGTFSKCMLPAFRLGYVMAPPWALRALVAAKNCADWHTSVPLQLGVAAFIEEGHLLKHVRRMRQIYKRRRSHLIDRLQRDLSLVLDVLPSHYGTHVSALTTIGEGFEESLNQLGKRGVRVHSLQRYRVASLGANGVVFGFGVADEQQIDHGLTELASALSRSR